MNGKTWTCNGNMTMNNDVVICNGKRLSDGEATSGPCTGSTTRRASNGGGQIDVRATVPPEARVDGTICGAVTLDKSSIVQKDATISGDFTLGKKVLVKAGANLSGRGRLGDGVVIGEGSNLSGNINLANAEIARGTNLSGNLNVDGVKLDGSVNCSGSGHILGNPPSNSAQ